MKFADIRVDSDFETILEDYKIFKRSIFMVWRDLNFTAFSLAKNELLDQAKTAEATVSRVIAATIVKRYSRDDLKTIVQLLLDVKLTGNPESDKFILRCIARACRGKGTIRTDYRKKQREKYLDGPTVRVDHQIIFIEQLVKKAPRVVCDWCDAIFSVIFSIAVDKDCASDVFDVFTEFMKVCGSCFVFPEKQVRELCKRIDNHVIRDMVYVMCDAYPNKHIGGLDCETMKTNGLGILVRQIKFFEEHQPEIVHLVREQHCLKLYAVLLDKYNGEEIDEAYLESIWSTIMEAVNGFTPPYELLPLLHQLKKLNIGRFKAMSMELCKCVKDNDCYPTDFILSVLCEATHPDFAPVMLEKFDLQCDECVMWMKTRDSIPFDEIVRRSIYNKLIHALYKGMFDDNIRADAVRCIGILGGEMYHGFFTWVMELGASDPMDSVRLAVVRIMVRPFPTISRNVRRELGLLITDQCFEVRFAAVRMICESFGSSEKDAMELLSRFLAVDSDPPLQRLCAEKAQIAAHILKKLPDVCGTMGKELVKKALQFLKARLNFIDMTVFENEYWISISVAHINIIGVLYKHKKMIMKRDEEMWNMFIMLLERSVSDREVIAILSNIDVIIRHEGVVKARTRPKIEEILRMIGNETMSPKIHEALLRIFSFVGLRRTQPKRDIAFIAGSDIASRVYNLRQERQQRNIVAVYCLDVMFHVLENKSLWKLEQIAVETIHRVLVSSNSSQLCHEFTKFLPWFWKYLALADRGNEKYRNMLCSLCACGKLIGDHDIPNIVEKVINFGSIEPVKYLAVSLKAKLKDCLPSIISFINSSTSEERAETLMFLIINCAKRGSEATIAMIDILLLIGQSSDVVFEPLVKIFGQRGSDWEPIARDRIVSVLTLCLKRIEHEAARELIYILNRNINKRFWPIIQRKLAEIGVNLEKWNYAMSTSGRSSSKKEVVDQMERNKRRTQKMENDFVRCFKDVDLGSPHRINEWFNTMRLECTEFAENVSVRACHSIAAVSDMVSLKLFNIAFYSRYVDLDMDRKKIISNVITTVLSKTDENIVLIAITDLIEFMDRAGAFLVNMLGANGPSSELSPMPVSIDRVFSPLSLRYVCANYEEPLSSEMESELHKVYSRLSLLREARNFAKSDSLGLSWSTILPHGVSGKCVQEALDDVLAGKDIHKRMKDWLGELGREMCCHFQHGFAIIRPLIIAARDLFELANIREKSDTHERITDCYGYFSSLYFPLLLRVTALSELGCDKDVRREKKALLVISMKHDMFDVAMDDIKRFFPVEDRRGKVQLCYANYLSRSSSVDNQNEAIDVLEKEVSRLSKKNSPLLTKVRRALARLLVRSTCGPEWNQERIEKIRECGYDKDDISTNYIWATANLNIIRSGAGLKPEAIHGYGMEAVQGFLKCMGNEKLWTVSLLHILTLIFHEPADKVESETLLDKFGDQLNNLPKECYVGLIDNIPYHFLEDDRNVEFLTKLLQGLLIDFSGGLVWPFIFSKKSDKYLKENGKGEWEMVKPKINQVIEYCSNQSESVRVVFEHGYAIASCMSKLFWTLPNLMGRLGSLVLRLNEKIGSLDTEACKRQFNKFIRYNRSKFKRIISAVNAIEKGEPCDERNVEFYRSRTDKVREFLTDIGNIFNMKAGERDVKSMLKGLVSKHKTSIEKFAMYERMRLAATGQLGFSLKNTVPELAKLVKMCIPVFGLYSTRRQNQITVNGWQNTVTIAKSLMRPRAAMIIGSDGNIYKFLIKFSEDLRVDQRAMQFFNMVNKFAHARIITYSITPMSTSMGAIQWLNQTRSISDMINDYRNVIHLKDRGDSIPIDQEMSSHKLREAKLLRDLGLDHPDKIPVDLRVELYKRVLNETHERKNDLREMIWYASPNSELWLQFVHNFTRSTGIMSIMGYVIGLGDRHVENILIENVSGNVAHIDFGDALWVASNRDKFKEKVPFRLTRMITACFGPTGISCSFKFYCEAVMSQLRRHQEAFMGVLNIFAKAPILPYGRSQHVHSRSVDDQEQKRGNQTVSKFASHIAGEGFESVSAHVASLINDATNPENLACMYPGWLPYW